MTTLPPKLGIEMQSFTSTERTSNIAASSDRQAHQEDTTSNMQTMVRTRFFVTLGLVLFDD
jgi:hypothetical protein